MKLPHWLKHRWGEWSTIAEGNINRTSDKVTLGQFLVQQSSCSVCKKARQQAVRTYFI